MKAVRDISIKDYIDTKEALLKIAKTIKKVLENNPILCDVGSKSILFDGTTVFVTDRFCNVGTPGYLFSNLPTSDLTAGHRLVLEELKPLVPNIRIEAIKKVFKAYRNINKGVTQWPNF